MSTGAANLAGVRDLPLRRARWATRVQFAVLGVLAGAWGAHLPSVKQRYALDEAALSIVLLAAALGAVSTLLFAGRVVARFGARRVVLGGGMAMCAAIASVTSIGYSGFMVGPPLIGGLAHASSLTAALSVVVIGAVLLALGAGRISARD